MNEHSAALGPADEHAAISKAWEQVSPEELVRALRQVPSKVRGRMLSTLKTPASKVTSLTARLLVTNLARATHRDRLRAADTIAGQAADELGESADKATSLEELTDAVLVEAKTSGQSIVVLAAVCGLVGETDRFAPVIIACRDAGYLGPELITLADSLVEVAEARLASNAAKAATSGLETSEHEPLENVWERAVAATGRLTEDIGAGRLPADSDLDLLWQYTDVLSSEAERFGVGATVAAIREAATRAEQDAALAGLADQLRRLAGPEDITAGLAAVHAAANQVSVDRTIADRLRRFLEVVSGSDNEARFQLARTLRGQPEPPSQDLLDAAMLGMLHIAEEIQDGHVTRETKPIPPAEAEGTAKPGKAQRVVPLDVGNASQVRPPFTGHSDVEPDPVAETAHDVGETLDGDTVAERSVTSAPEQLAQENGQDADSEVFAVVGAGVPTADDLESSPAPLALTAGPGEVQDRQAAVNKGQTATTTRAPTEAEPPSAVEAEPAAGDETQRSLEVLDACEVLTREECSRALTRLISDRRFSLAYHLARALGQDVRAAVLGEAALAEGVRHSASPAANEMVERSLTVPIPAEDRGSLALRVASAARVALLDPSSGAGEVLRPILDSLAGMSALKAFAVAVIDASVQNFTLSAAGSSGDADRAREQASAIASWAADTLARPRHNLPYTGTEIWKALTEPAEPLGQVLAILAANDADQVEEVRRLCRKISSPKDLEKAVLAADGALRGGKKRGSLTITGGAKQSLKRALKEVIDQGWAWADAVRLTHPTREGVLRVRTEAWELRERLQGELDGCGDDDVTAASLLAAATSLTETISLFGDGALDGEEAEPDAALNRDLVLVHGLAFDESGVPVRTPQVEELIRAASETKAEAFEYRLAISDFPIAETIISLPGMEGERFDEIAARKILRSREGEAAREMRERWVELDRKYAAARARGRISDADAAALGGQLQQANPAPDDAMRRRDLGQVAAELDQLDADLADATERRREAVRADIDDAVDSGELDAAWTARLSELLDRDELGAAEEYLHRARAGEKSPEDAPTAHEPEGMLGAILAANPDGVTAEIVDAVRAGGQRELLDFSTLDQTERASIADALDAWVRLRFEERPANLDEPLFKVLRLLGIIPRAINRPPDLRTASTAKYWFVDVDAETSGHAYVPDYGSRSGGRRRLMLCWAEDLPVSQLWTLARTSATDDRPVYVLYFGTLSVKSRLDLARHARAAHGQGMAVIDSTVVLRCATAARQTYDVAMRAVLPYVAPNPYDPNLLVGMPPEMFYGRRVERDSVKSLNGTSIISGGRRFGKSALLRSAQQELAHDNPDVTAELIVIQDVAAPPKNDPTELWPRLAGRLSEEGVLPATVLGTADGVCSGIRAWLTTNPHKRLLLMLDECDFFLRADANSGFANVVRLRDTMVDGGGRFKVVFSGLQHVARYRRLPNQPLSHFSEPLVIGPLDAASASDLVRRPLHAIGWAISEAQVDRIVTYCVCNPSVIQLACATLIARLNAEEVLELAPWTVPDTVIDGLLRSPEVGQGVRDRLFLTLELDHRYKLLAYLLAWRANAHGLGTAVPPAELRRMATEWWPEGFSSQRTDDVRALCDEMVGLGVFAGDADTGYRMLSPGMVRVFGDIDEITEELLSASDSYEKDRAVGAAGSRMKLSPLGQHRYSPLTAAQLADVLGAGTTQLRVVVGSRATRIDAVPQALVTAARQLPESYASVTEVNSLKAWRDNMRAPTSGHLVVVSDMTLRGSEASWEESVESARRRGATRTGRGTRSAVLVAGPEHRWLLRRLVDRPDGASGDLADVAVGLQGVDAISLQAWDHIEELDISSQARQRKLLEATGGWPFLVERVLSQRVAAGGFDYSLAAVAAHLATSEGAAELIAAAGLDPGDPDQSADAGLVAVFDRLVETGWREGLADLAGLLELDESLRGEDDPAEAVAILAVLGVLAETDEGIFGAEPVLSACWKLHRPLAAV
jgi:hypothetical protein